MKPTNEKTPALLKYYPDITSKTICVYALFWHLECHAKALHITLRTFNFNYT